MQQVIIGLSLTRVPHAWEENVPRPGDLAWRDNYRLVYTTLAVPDRPDLMIRRLEGHDQRTKRGRKRLFNAAIHALRTRVDRTFAWEDKFKRLLLRFERIQQRHFGMKLMAYTLINLREFCGA